MVCRTLTQSRLVDNLFSIQNEKLFYRVSNNNNNENLARYF